MASWLLVGAPANATPSPAPGPVPAVPSGDACSSRFNAPGAATVGGSSLRIAARTAIWNTGPGTCGVTYSFSRTYTPTTSGYYTLANSFAGTLFMATADFTGSFAVRLDSGLVDAPGSALSLSSGQVVDTPLPSVGFGAGSVSSQFGLHAGYDYTWVSTLTLSVTTDHVLAMDTPVDFEGSTPGTTPYNARSVLTFVSAADVPAPSPVPEPATGALLAAGVLTLAALRLRPAGFRDRPGVVPLWCPDVDARGSRRHG